MSSFRINKSSSSFIPPITTTPIPSWQLDSSNNISYSGGNVGINTFNPQNSLDINGNINILARTTDPSGNTTMITPYYNANGTAVNNTFYPGLGESNSIKAVSRWTSRSSPVSLSWNSICWSPQLTRFVVIPYSAANGLVSTDGINWTSTTVPSNTWTSVCWSPELSLFVAVAAYTSLPSDPRVMTSPDGIIWTTRTAASNNDWLSVTWSPERRIFVAVASSGSGNRVMTSSDGINWVSQTCVDNNWRAVTWSRELGLFCAVARSGSGNRVMTSPDGITWTTRNSASNNSWMDVCWSSQLSLFVAVSENGSGNRVMTSPDGINWTSRVSAADFDWQSIAWSPQLRVFCAVPYVAGSNQIMTSFDGITWTLRNSISSGWQSITWSPELGIFCAVAFGGASRIMTSSLTARPPTSYNLFDTSFNIINERGLWNFQSFSRGVPVLKTGSSTITINPGENWVDCSTSADVSCNLPSAVSYPGLEITLKNTSASTTSRIDAAVLNRTSNAPTGTLLPNTRGSWVTIVSNGTNWVVENGT